MTLKLKLACTGNVSPVRASHSNEGAHPEQEPHGGTSGSRKKIMKKKRMEKERRSL